MAIFDLFRRAPKAEERADVNPDRGETVASDTLLTALLGKDVVTRESAEQIPTVSACVDLIASTVSALPIKLYRKRSGGRPEEITDDGRLFLLNDDTGDTLTAAQFWRAILADYYLGKGGFAYLNFTHGTLSSIHYVEENAVSYVKNTDPIFKDYDLYVNGKSYHPWQFFRLLRHTRDGITGKPIQEENPMLITVAYRELVYERNLIARGGNKRGFLQSENTLSESAFAKLKEGFRRLYSSNDENVVVLNKGVKFQEASNTSVEMQLNENKASNAEEICKLFGVPIRILVGGATPEDEKIFARTIARVCWDIECSLDRDLLLEDEKAEKYFAFDLRELTRGNLKERYEAYRAGLEARFLQVDEVREMEDLEPIGFKWITLGLDSVLLDPKTGTIYTPNTNAMTNMAARKIDGGTGTEAETEDGTDPEGTGTEEATRAADGRVLIVCGAPGSGKTTWVREHAAEGDLVIDLDRVKHAIFAGIEKHGEIGDEAVDVLRSVRDALFRKIAAGDFEGRAYVITTETDADRLERWREWLGADITVMPTTKEECLRRIEADPDRADKELFTELVEKWFSEFKGVSE